QIINVNQVCILLLHSLFVKKAGTSISEVPAFFYTDLPADPASPDLQEERKRGSAPYPLR
ncbi:MAG: hypothetical protein J6P89_07095, partial [Oscillospiraceae bacterium]|nr:hypothetical protein [Oscillospiraceae bacterium]